MTITNNVSNYNDVLLVSQSSLGFYSVAALFFMSIWVVCHAEFISASHCLHSLDVSLPEHRP